MFSALRQHWPEYLVEAWALGTFMVSAAFFTALLEYPGSPVHKLIPNCPKLHHGTRQRCIFCGQIIQFVGVAGAKLISKSQFKIRKQGYALDSPAGVQLIRVQWSFREGAVQPCRMPEFA